MRMIRELKAIAAYIIYPFCFLMIGCLLWIIGGEQVYQMVDGKICMLITNNAPQTEGWNEPIVSSEEQNNAGLDIGEDQVPVYGEQFGSILCEVRGLSAPLYYGDDEELLRLGAGQYKDSAIPGKLGTCIIGAHDTTYFAPLKEVQVGDKIEIQTDYGDFLYEVKATKIAKVSDITAYQLDQKEETVILYTCYPFGRVQEVRDSRYYVYCTRLVTKN